MYRTGGEVFLKCQVAEFPNRLFVSLVFLPNATGLDEDAGTFFQVLEKLAWFSATNCANCRILVAKIVQQFENLVVGQLLHTASTHFVGEVFELGYGFIFFNDLVASRIPVEQHGDGFGVELGTTIGEFADLAFHQGKRRQ